MKTNINKLIATIAICAIGLISASAYAARGEEGQRQVQLLMQAKLQTQAVEAQKLVECNKHLEQTHNQPKS